MSRSFTQHAICMCFLKLWRDCPPQGLLPRAISNNSSTAALILALTWTRGQSGFDINRQRGRVMRRSTTYEITPLELYTFLLPSFI